MSKCNNCYHKKVCIDGANDKNAESCKHYVPAADVQEVKHGYWICTELMYENGVTMCSECKTEYYVSSLEEVCGDVLPTFCPICGARMDGENND